jgi:hypothetical protein
MKVYDGSNWLNAYASLSGALLATSNLSDLNNTATARTNLGVAIGTNVQAWDADLDTWATKTAPSGTVVGTSDTQTLTNKTLTSPVVTGGSINNTPIGATTASTGSFSTLAASGTTTLSGNQIISVTDNSNAALRITQLGTGNALLVEDSTNPDATPFVVDASGRTVLGNTTNILTLDLFEIHSTGSATSYAASIFNWSATTGFANQYFYRSKSGTVGTQGVVASGDNIGAIRFAADDGTAFINAAQIVAAVDGTPGTSDMPGRLVFSTTADGASSPTERMRIDSAGAVGIGSTSLTGYALRLGKNLTGAVTSTSLLAGGTVQPDVTTSALYLASSPSTASNGGTPYTISNLHHHYASQGTFNADSTVTNQFGFSAQSSITGATNNYGFYGNIASGTGRWNFYANGTAANYFGGNVGIGTSAPAQLLEVAASNNGLTSTTANNTIRLTDTDTTSATNQPIGKIEFYSSDANAPAGVKAYVLATSNGVQPGSSLSFATANTAADATEAMRIDSSGNVGVRSSGTTTPTYDFNTLGEGLWSRYWDSSGNRFADLVAIGNTPAGATMTMRFFTNEGGSAGTATEKMRINSSGYVLVGCTALPSSSVAGVSLSPSVTSVNPHFFSAGSATGAVAQINFINGNGTVGQISTNGSLTTYAVSSDRRLKENIVPLTTGLASVLSLKPSQYNYKADPTTSIQGFIADELQQVVPHAVLGEANAVDKNGTPIYQGVDASFLIPFLVSAIQELNAKITALENK